MQAVHRRLCIARKYDFVGPGAIITVDDEENETPYSNLKRVVVTIGKSL